MYSREYMSITRMYQNITSLWSKDGGGRLLADKRLLELGNNNTITWCNKNKYT